MTTLQKDKKNKNGLNGIILLEGHTTIRGQIKARKKGLFYCLQPNRDNTSESQNRAWLDSHTEILRKLYALARRHGIKVKP